MDKIEKALKKLSAKEKVAIRKLLENLYSRNLKSLDIKKLRGRSDIFRARKGSLRIIYRLLNNGSIFILTIERRNENTYNL